MTYRVVYYSTKHYRNLVETVNAHCLSEVLEKAQNQAGISDNQTVSVYEGVKPYTLVYVGTIGDFKNGNCI